MSDIFFSFIFSSLPGPSSPEQEAAALEWHHVRNVLNVMVVLLEEKDTGILECFVEAEAHLQLGLHF